MPEAHQGLLNHASRQSPAPRHPCQAPSSDTGSRLLPPHQAAAQCKNHINMSGGMQRALLLAGSSSCRGLLASHARRASAAASLAGPQLAAACAPPGCCWPLHHAPAPPPYQEIMSRTMQGPQLKPGSRFEGLSPCPKRRHSTVHCLYPSSQAQASGFTAAWPPATKFGSWVRGGILGLLSHRLQACSVARQLREAAKDAARGWLQPGRECWAYNR